LYVEDSPLDAELTRLELSRRAPQIELSIAASVREAQYDLAARSYDVLLTDLHLPDGRGFDVLAYVRSKNLALPVVVVTGQGDEVTAVAALKAGACDYIVKRHDYLARLAQTLESAVQRYQLERTRQARTLRVLYMGQNPGEGELICAHMDAHAPHIHLETVYVLQEMLKRLPAGAGLGAYDVILLDYRLDSLEALDILKELRQGRGLELPVVLVTAHGDEEAAAQALRLGASDYLTKSAGYLYQLPAALENAYHRFQLQRANAALRQAYDATLEGWIRALDLRDMEDEGHTQRVTELSLRLALALGIREEQLEHVRRGALLHDIGKIGIPDSVLHKTSPFTEADWQVIHQHPVHARSLLEPIEFLRPALDIPYCHHEKWDGTGYPQGLAGEAIPLAARIFAVVDVWDALTTDRFYRQAWTRAQVADYLRSLSGTHFDPAVVEAFLKLQEI
jgi:putative two-component system response regulator